MTRSIDSNAQTELNKVVTYPIELISFILNKDEVNENLYLNTGYKSVTYNEQTYSPGAGVISFTAIEETKDAKTNSINVDLNGVPNTIISALENIDGTMVGGVNVYKSAIGAQVTLYQGFWDETNGRLLQKSTADQTPGEDIHEVYQKWQGIITSFNVTEENQLAGNVRIGIECKSSIGILLDTKAGRYTSDASIQQFNPTDMSMEFVPSLIDWNPSFGAEE